MNILFPAYRKLSNLKQYYKINSQNEFEEIQLVGSIKNHFVHQAEQYPEKLKIIDMLALKSPYLESNEQEWTKILI